MPKAQRHKPQIPENPRPATNHITPRSTAVVPPAVEFPEKRTSPSPAPLASTQPTFNPIHPVHFDELNRIWDADRRIPSAISRREWALPRNLNPVNVHSWWYRRRAVAKKLRIKIPGATYELAVGEPPIIVNEEEKEGEEAMLGNDDSDKEVDMDMDRSSEVTLVPGSEFDAPLIPHSEWLPQTPTKKRAYTHPSPTHNHNPSSLAGSLPPSSPPASPPLISWLVSPSLSADLSGSPAPSLEYTCSLSFGNPKYLQNECFLDTDIVPTEDPSSYSSPSSTQTASLICASLNQALFYASSNDPSASASKSASGTGYLTWCIDGTRFAYDGSRLCVCPCSAFSGPGASFILFA